MALLDRKQKSMEAYQAEIVCMTRLQAEIVHLRMMVDTQQQLIDSMARKNEMLHSDKFFAGFVRNISLYHLRLHCKRQDPGSVCFVVFGQYLFFHHRFFVTLIFYIRNMELILLLIVLNSSFVFVEFLMCVAFH